MCRKNQLLGWCTGALGFGLIVGSVLESELLTISLGIGLILGGLYCVRIK